MFRDAQYRLWHANLAARRALKRGVPATLSGTPKYNAHANDIDFQIEADFIGLMTPGMLQASNDLGLRAGRVMNSGDGINGGLFVSAMYAAAFFESDPRRTGGGRRGRPAAGERVRAPDQRRPPVVTGTPRRLDRGLAAHPRQMGRRRALSPRRPRSRSTSTPRSTAPMSRSGCCTGGGDFRRHHGDRHPLRPGLGLQSRQCRGSARRGARLRGHPRGVPERDTRGIADETFSYTDYSFNTIVESTMKRAIAMAERHGGRVDGDRLIVNDPGPRAPAQLEMWDDFGSPVELIPIDDPRWSLEGAWEEGSYNKGQWDFRVGSPAATRGPRRRSDFDGSGAIIGGFYMPTGGLADVYLDGELDRTVDVNSDEDSTKVNESVWHAFGLEDTEHELRVVVRGEPYRGSDKVEREGTDVALSYLKVFR